ncbi:MAG: AAA family ATPase [Mycobacterium leprae]
MKHVIILVGPKGAGKSTIGDLLAKELGVRFVRVEPIFLAVREALGPAHPDYERCGFEAVRSRLTAELASADTICFESTGASDHFRWLMTELGRIAIILPVRVVAEPAQSIDRNNNRDAANNVPV